VPWFSFSSVSFLIITSDSLSLLGVSDIPAKSRFTIVPRKECVESGAADGFRKCSGKGERGSASLYEGSGDHFNKSPCHVTLRQDCVTTIDQAVRKAVGVIDRGSDFISVLQSLQKLI
jgi:hypothetical protein